MPRLDPPRFIIPNRPWAALPDDAGFLPAGDLVEGQLQVPEKKLIFATDNTIDFDKTPMGQIFKVNPWFLPVETVLSFAKHHPHLFENQYKFKDGSVHVGLEVEVENVLRIDPQLPLCFWSIHEDGSLRNRGREFKTHPMPLKYMEAALKQLFSAINDDVDFSKRTSIHLHVDMRQLTPSQIMGVVYTYAVLENILFKYAGSNRRNSIFCVPIIETDALFNKGNKDKRLSTFLNLHKGWQKYTALNLKPLRDLGTIEFRQLPGTTNIQKILVWLDLLTRIRIFAYRYSLSEIVTQISELNTSSAYKHFVQNVFGDLSVYLDTSNLLPEMEKACYLVKNAEVTNEFHQKVLSKLTSNSALSIFLKPKPVEQKDVAFSEAELNALDIITRKFLNNRAQDFADKWRIVKNNFDTIVGMCTGAPDLMHCMEILNERYRRERIPF